MITGIVLAGGGGRRFGGDKLAAELDGISVLARTIAGVAAVADRVVVAGPSLPVGLEAGGTPVTLVRDRTARGGPAVALADALESVGTAGPDGSLALVVGGDMPMIVAAVLRSLLEALASDRTVDAVVLEARHAERRQVLPLALRVDAGRRAASSMLEAGDRSLGSLVDRLATAELPADAWRMLDPSGVTLADIDTPADLDQLRALAVERSGNNDRP